MQFSNADNSSDIVLVLGRGCPGPSDFPKDSNNNLIIQVPKEYLKFEEKINKGTLHYKSDLFIIIKNQIQKIGKVQSPNVGRHFVTDVKSGVKLKL